MRFFSTIISVGMLTIIALLIGVCMTFYAFKAPGPLAEDKIVFIKPGSSAYAIADTFKQQGIMTSKIAFLMPYVVRIRYNAQGLQAGEYKIPAKTSAMQAIKMLEKGKTLQRQITFAEGLSSVEIVEILNNAEAMTGEITEIPAEGSLLPESYAYTRDEDRQKLVERMQSHMQDAINDLWEGRVENLPFDTIEEAITLASIVEKETAIPSERPRVAGVFVNRLRKGMLLQTDPTVIYAITKGKEKFDRKLYYKDLKRDDPYNTYVYAGLPPGPIANPGRESLAAVLNPEEHDYLYFVADGTGGHVFAKTLDEHNKNVAAWRKINKK